MVSFMHEGEKLVLKDEVLIRLKGMVTFALLDAEVKREVGDKWRLDVRRFKDERGERVEDIGEDERVFKLPVVCVVDEDWYKSGKA